MQSQNFLTNAVGEVIKKYDDRPLWEQNKNSQEDIGYSKSGFSKPKLAPTGNPSPIQRWWFEEIRKRNVNLENQIDINEIKAAAKGVKNKWRKVVTENAEKFKSLIENRKFEWDELLNLRNADAQTCS